eukprot:1675607-Rhodomonas_salina.1
MSLGVAACPWQPSAYAYTPTHSCITTSTTKSNTRNHLSWGVCRIAACTRIDHAQTRIVMLMRLRARSAPPPAAPHRRRQRQPARGPGTRAFSAISLLKGL